MHCFVAVNAVKMKYHSETSGLCLLERKCATEDEELGAGLSEYMSQCVTDIVQITAKNSRFALIDLGLPQSKKILKLLKDFR